MSYTPRLTDAERVLALPPLLRAIVTALGWDRAMDILRRHGGTRVTIPKHRSHVLGLSDTELKALRRALALHISADLARNVLHLPKVDKLMLQLRNDRIRSQRSHSSLKKLAKEHRLTERRILQICQANENAGGCVSLPLF